MTLFKVSFIISIHIFSLYIYLLIHPRKQSTTLDLVTNSFRNNEFYDTHLLLPCLDENNKASSLGKVLACSTSKVSQTTKKKKST